MVRGNLHCNLKKRKEKYKMLIIYLKLNIFQNLMHSTACCVFKNKIV